MADNQINDEAEQTANLLQDEPSNDDDVEILGPTIRGGGRSVKRELIATLIVCLGPLGVGFVLGYSSPTVSELRGLGILTKDTAALFESIVTLGAAAGGPIAGLLVIKLGRKITIMLSGSILVFGWLFIMFFLPSLMMLGRGLTGVGMGMISLSVPLYIAEVASKQLRGMLGNCFQLFITFGIVGAFGLGTVLTWKWLALASSSIVTLLVLFILPLPETPRWLLSQKDKISALKSLFWFRRSQTHVVEECAELENAITSQAYETVQLKHFLQPSVFKPMLIMIMLMFFQQASGINCVIFNVKDIFEESGFKNSGSIPSLIIGGVQVIATFLSCIFVDILGRRTLLISSGTFMFLSTFSFGLYYFLTEQKLVDSSHLQWLSLASLIVYITAFSFGWGPIPWMIMGELLPMKVKGIISSIATMVNWLVSFAVTMAFPYIKPNEVAFWLFCGICLLGVIFVAIVLPETKGKSLEEIEEHFKKQDRDVDNTPNETLIQ